MAVDFKVDKQHLKRGSMYAIDPRRVKVNPELNGRHDLPPIDDLIESFQEHGQLMPCPVGNDGGDPVLRMGHRRWRAAMHLTELSPLPDLGYWPLQCVYYSGNEWDAYLAAIAENHHRESTTAIDDAQNCARMERKGMDHPAIAKVFYPAAKNDEDKLKSAVAWVKQRLALVTLAPEGVEAVKNGRLKPTAAVAIAKLSQKAQKDLFAKNRDAKHITGAAVSTPENGNSHVKSRKISELRSFWTPYADQKQESKINRFASAHLSYLAGGDVDEYFKTVTELLG